MRTLRKISPIYIRKILHTCIIRSPRDWKLHEDVGKLGTVHMYLV